MRPKTYLTILYLIFSLSEAIACDCQPKTSKAIRQDSYHNAELVFLGELRNKNTEEGSYTFEVLEVYKGIIRNSQIVHGRQHSSCSNPLYVDGLWLVYASIEADSLIDISICGASRGIKMPFLTPPVLPPRQNNQLDSLNRELSIVNQKYEALTDWISDLENYHHLKPQIERTKSIETSTIVAIFNSILLILFAIYVFRKKNTRR